MPPTSISGTLYQAQPLSDGASRLVLSQVHVRNLLPEQTPDYIRVKVSTPFAELPSAASRINVWGPIWPSSGPAIPNGFDFRRQAFFKGINANAVNLGEFRYSATTPSDFSYIEKIHLYFEQTKRALADQTYTRLEGSKGAMTAALLTGIQTGISPEVMEDMRRSGLSHLLSVSGLHVSMVALLVFLPLRFLFSLWPWLALRLSTKKLAAIGTLVSTLLYTLLIGPEAPTVRSALMSGGVMLAILLDRKPKGLRLIALAALVILFVMPSALLGPSFQLSFAAVLAMVAAYEKRVDSTIKELPAFQLPAGVRPVLRALRDIVLTSLIATAATAPFTLYHFQSFNFYGVVANMVAIPLTSFWVMPNLLLTYLMAPFGLAGLFLDAAGWGLSYVIDLAHLIAAWPHAKVAAPSMPDWALLSFVLGFLWLCLWQGRPRFIGLLPILACFLYPTTIVQPSVFIDNEGKNWAVVLNDGRLATYGKRKENYILGQWQRYLQDADLALFSRKEPPNPSSGLSCIEHHCTYNTVAGDFVFLEKKATAEEISAACAQAKVVVSREELTECSATHVIDARAIKQHGAHSFTIKGQRLIPQIDHETQGMRPWDKGFSISAPDRQDDLEP